MAKAAGGLRAYAKRKGYKVRKLSGNRTSNGRYRYAMGEASGRGGMNMRAKNASDGIELIRRMEAINAYARARWG